MTRSALLLIDIQNDYFPSIENSRMPLPDMDEAAARAARLLSTARSNGTTVIHVKHVMTSDAAPFFRPGTPGADLHDSVKPSISETVIEKTRPNSFVGTDLEDCLRREQIERVIMCGAMSQMCVDATVRAAVDLGFAVMVAHDACAAANVEHNGVSVPSHMVHASIMAPLAASYANVLLASECLAEAQN